MKIITRAICSNFYDPFFGIYNTFNIRSLHRIQFISSYVRLQSLCIKLTQNMQIRKYTALAQENRKQRPRMKCMYEEFKI